MEKKTLKEIKAHCLKNGYATNEMFKICGWLVAKGIKDNKEPIPYKNGERTFDDFIAWFEGKKNIEVEGLYKVGEEVVWVRALLYGEKFIGTTSDASTRIYGIDEITGDSTEDERNVFNDELCNMHEEYEFDVFGCFGCNEVCLESDYDDDSLEYANKRFGLMMELVGKKFQQGNTIKEFYESIVGNLEYLLDFIKSNKNE